MFVDSHCHLHLLDLSKEQDTIDNVVQRAHDKGVTHMLCVCTELAEYQTLVDIADKYDDIRISVGVHPNHQPGQAVDLDEILQMASHDKVVAIGETGLDYFRSEADSTWQKDRFALHIEASKQTKKPLIIHTRQAKADTIDMMRVEKANEARGVMHCFTEDWAMAKQALDLDFYISFSGIVTFKNATQLQEVAQKVPADRFLIETDCPYLAPVPHRGKQNEPSFVPHVAEFIANLRGEPVEQIAQLSTQNYFDLFGN